MILLRAFRQHFERFGSIVWTRGVVLGLGNMTFTAIAGGTTRPLHLVLLLFRCHLVLVVSINGLKT